MNIIQDKIIYSALESRPPPPNQPYIKRLLAQVEQELNNTGDREWLVDTETGLIHKISAIEPESRWVAGALHNLGFGSGDILQTGYSTCLDFYWPVLGAWLCGGTASLGDPNLPPSVIKQQIEETKAKIIVCSKLYLDKYQKLTEELNQTGNPLKLIILDATEDDILPSSVISFKALTGLQNDMWKPNYLNYSPDSLSIILWSSGSSGSPKGILHSQQNLHNLYFGEDINPKTALLSSLMFHVSGFTFCLVLGILGGTVFYLIKEKCFSGENWAQIAQQVQPEHVFCGVSQYIQISNVQGSGRNLKGIRKITPLGGAVSPGCSEKVLNMLGSHATLVEMYGSTEVMFVSKQEVTEIEFGLLGTLAAENQIYIQDINTGEILGPGKMGKIMAKTKNMMLKYLNRETDTEEFFNKDGFGYTGDIGFYNNAGKIFFSYRMREVLKVDNYWFGPAEIENLLEKVPGIDEACVWGEYDPKTGNDQVEVNNLISQSKRKLICLK